LLNFGFLGTSLIGSLVMALTSALASPPAQLAVLGGTMSILAGLLVSYMEQEDERERRRESLLEQLDVPLALAPNRAFFDVYSRLTRSLVAVARQDDPVLRDFSLVRLASINEQMRTLAEGLLVFTDTETWRTVYEQILESPGLGHYDSVAWVKTSDYWQDQPGQQSMRLNYELARRGLRIQRIVILRGELWPVNDRLPSPTIRGWIEEQLRHGLDVSVVREAELVMEADLLCDFAIYGERATGIQELDEEARTIRFVLSFDRRGITLASERWARISLYATPYSELLRKTAIGYAGAVRYP
jgi:hypothetical protein